MCLSWMSDVFPARSQDDDPPRYKTFDERTLLHDQEKRSRLVGPRFPLQEYLGARVLPSAESRHIHERLRVFSRYC